MAKSEESKEYNDKEIILINIGFNKGYNFAVWLNTFTSLNVSSSVWYDYLQKWKSMNNKVVNQVDCGNCNDCKFTYNIRNINTNRIRFIGIDLNKQNVELVSGVFSSLNTTGQLKGVSVQLLHAAGGPRPGVLRIPKCPPGNELCRIPDSVNETSSNFDNVQVVTVDNIIRNISSFDGRRKIVDILMVDTEGHDALILEGASHHIRQQAIRCIIFEYHFLKPWLTMRLESTIEFLRAHKYVCFLQGQKRLWPISGSFWNPLYEFHYWSNVMCIHENDKWLDRVSEYIVTSDYLENMMERITHDLSGRLVKIPNENTVFLIYNHTKILMSKARLGGYSSIDIIEVRKSFLDMVERS